MATGKLIAQLIKAPESVMVKREPAIDDQGLGEMRLQGAIE